MQPQIVTEEVRLVGVQGIIPSNANLPQVLEKRYERLFTRLDDIPDINASTKTIGDWYFIDNQTKLHFASVKVDTFKNFKWDYEYGLVAWSLGRRPGQSGRKKTVKKVK